MSGGQGATGGGAGSGGGFHTPSVLAEEEERRLQGEYRQRVREYDEIEDDLRASKTFQRIFVLCLAGVIVLAFLLGYTVIIGLWESKPKFARWAGLVIVSILWIVLTWVIWKNRKRIVAHAGSLRNALQDRQTAAARLPLDSSSALRIYREASLDLIAQYRESASRNRRVHNAFQLVIISGSIITSTLTAMNQGSTKVLAISTSALSALVGISAGVTGYFKFRERGYNLQSSADEIEKNYNASQFMLDEYASQNGVSLSETDRLRLFSKYVERIKEEQRKRELQLEQSSSGREGNAS